MAAVASPVTRTVLGSTSMSWGVVPPTPWTSNSSAGPVLRGAGVGGGTWVSLSQGEGG
ncbi:hypothetical protein JCM13580A_59420 [Streptomyces drozdowiczii]